MTTVYPGITTDRLRWNRLRKSYSRSFTLDRPSGYTRHTWEAAGRQGLRFRGPALPAASFFVFRQGFQKTTESLICIKGWGYIVTPLPFLRGKRNRYPSLFCVLSGLEAGSALYPPLFFAQAERKRHVLRSSGMWNEDCETPCGNRDDPAADGWQAAHQPGLLPCPGKWAAQRLPGIAGGDVTHFWSLFGLPHLGYGRPGGKLFCF